VLHYRPLRWFIIFFVSFLLLESNFFRRLFYSANRRKKVAAFALDIKLAFWNVRSLFSKVTTLFTFQIPPPTTHDKLQPFSAIDHHSILGKSILP
jgi:hypothetical protein